MTLDNDSPHDWISEIAGCDLDLTFNSLYQVLKRDVEIANNLPAQKRRNYRFKLERNGEGISHVLRVMRGVEGKDLWDHKNKVEFDLHDNALRLDCPHLNNGFTMIYPRWDSETSSCKLYINDKHMKVWEISKLALQPLIFG